VTATVFAEILVIGFQTFAFIALAVVALVGLPSSDPATVDVVKAWGPVLAVPVLGIAYTLDVVMDRIADFVTKWQDNKLRKAVTGTGPKVTEMRHAILAKQEAVMEPLEYSLSRLRIARATSINAALILACASWIARTTGSSFWGVSAVASGLVSVATIYAWYDLASSYYKRVAGAYRETSEMTSTLWSRVSVRKLQREVAAVCYRRTDSGIRFLLVKTGSGNWTFPKGHAPRGTSSQACLKAKQHTARLRKRLGLAEPFCQSRSRHTCMSRATRPSSSLSERTCSMFEIPDHLRSPGESRRGTVARMPRRNWPKTARRSTLTNWLA
jgi:hypothetical protein